MAASISHAPSDSSTPARRRVERLQKLVELGYLEAVRVEEGPRPTTIYRPTEKGIEAVRAWTATPTAAPRIDSDLVASDPCLAVHAAGGRARIVAGAAPASDGPVGPVRRRGRRPGFHRGRPSWSASTSRSCSARISGGSGGEAPGEECVRVTAGKACAESRDRGLNTGRCGPRGAPFEDRGGLGERWSRGRTRCTTPNTTTGRDGPSRRRRHRPARGLVGRRGVRRDPRDRSFGTNWSVSWAGGQLPRNVASAAQPGRRPSFAPLWEEHELGGGDPQLHPELLHRSLRGVAVGFIVPDSVPPELGRSPAAFGPPGHVERHIPPRPAVATHYCLSVDPCENILVLLARVSREVVDHGDRASRARRRGTRRSRR